MRHVGEIVISVLVIIFAVSGCVKEPGIDKAKFTELNRTARELRDSIKSDTPCDVPDMLLQKLASGTSALKEKAASKAESDVIAAYMQLLTSYRDGLLLCQYRNQLNHFQFVPKGRIYVSQELDHLIDKYGLSTESHLYKPTGVHWRSIAEDSIKVIWESAEIQTKNIENMVNYN